MPELSLIFINGLGQQSRTQKSTQAKQTILKFKMDHTTF